MAGRNELCSCGSGKKYKKCCGAKARSRPRGSIVPSYMPVSAKSLVGRVSVRPSSSSLNKIGPPEQSSDDAKC